MLCSLVNDGKNSHLGLAISANTSNCCFHKMSVSWRFANKSLTDLHNKKKACCEIKPYMFITTAVDLFQEVPRAMQKQTGLRKLRNSIIMNTYTRSQHITHSNKGIRYINGNILAEKTVLSCWKHTKNAWEHYTRFLDKKCKNESRHNLLTCPLRNSPTLCAEWA